MVPYIFIAALLPVLILAFYMYNKDKAQPEPISQLLKAIMFGALSVPMSLGVSLLLILMGVNVNSEETTLECISSAFLGAAIPEELAKLAMLYLLLRKNKYFDEKIDGIVYAVFVSLGFAALENVMYLFNNYDSWMSVGISRAIFSIPGHFGFGILMGYYYSLAHFYPKNRTRNIWLAFLAPMLVHGVFDTILFVSSITPMFSGLLTIIFIIFCHMLWKSGKVRIQEHLLRDKSN